MAQAQTTCDYSVLMSVYAKDDPAYLDAALASMVGQTLPPRQMVVVCDGPLNPELDALLASWDARHPGLFCLVRLACNGGLGNALREGLAHCACEVVARMDADDISRPERCELLAGELLEKDLSVVGGAIAEFNQTPGDMESVRRNPATHQEICQRAKSRNPLNHVSVMFRKADVLAAGGYEDFFLLEDYYLWVRMIQKGFVLGNVDDVVVDVRVGSGMIGRRSSMAYLQSQLRFFTYLRQTGFVSAGECLKAKAMRTAATFVPKSLLKRLYATFLRTK